MLLHANDVNQKITNNCMYSMLQRAASSLQPFECLKNPPCDPAYPEMHKKGNSGNRVSLVRQTHYKATIISLPIDDRLLLRTPNHKARRGTS